MQIYSLLDEGVARALFKKLLFCVASALLISTAYSQRPTPAQPPGVQFDANLSYSTEGELILSYALTNGGAKPLVVDPAKLFIYYGPNSIPYKLVRSPAPGLANRLSLGETEHGTVTIGDPPFDSDNLQLVWLLFEIGPNLEHTLLIHFGDMISSGYTSDTYLGRQSLLALGDLCRNALAPLRVSTQKVMKRSSTTPIFFYRLHRSGTDSVCALVPNHSRSFSTSPYLPTPARQSTGSNHRFVIAEQYRVRASARVALPFDLERAFGRRYDRTAS